MKRSLDTSRWDPLAHRKSDDVWKTRFAEELEAALRWRIEPGTFVTITRHGNRKSSEPATMHGVVESVHAHGFVVRGPKYRTFTAYIDLFCQEGRTTIAAPARLGTAVLEVCMRFRQRLPRRGVRPVAAPQKVAPVQNSVGNGKVAEFERQQRLVDIMRGSMAEGGAVRMVR